MVLPLFRGQFDIFEMWSVEQKPLRFKTLIGKKE